MPYCTGPDHRSSRSLATWPRRLALLLLICTFGALLPVSMVSADEAETPAKQDWRPDDSEFEAMTESLRLYFDLEEERFLGRLEVMERLKAWKEKGYDLLGDMPTLRKLINNARWFRDPVWDRKWQRDHNFDGKRKGKIQTLKSDDMRFSVKPSKDYPRKHEDFFKGTDRDGPWPLLVTLNNRIHYTGEKYPAVETIKDYYPRELKDLTDEWHILVPIAPAGRYTERDGSVRRDLIINPLVFMFPHLHIDFDRIVMDGGEVIPSVAPFICTFVSGFVIREGQLSEADARMVKNWKQIPTYVVDNKRLATKLKEAGHETVTEGDKLGVGEWIKKVKRAVPKNFSWRIEGPQHQFAYWVNVDVATADAPDQELDVKVDDEKNEIQIEAKGIKQVSLFLNDEIVDMDRPVRVVINGHEEFKGDVERKFDTFFDTDPLVLRETMFFGLLFSHRLTQIDVRPPKKEEPKEEVPKASKDEEARAERYMNIAKKAMGEGDTDTARKALGKIIEDLPLNSHTAEAKKLLADLEDE